MGLRMSGNTVITEHANTQFFTRHKPRGCYASFRFVATVCFALASMSACAAAPAPHEVVSGVITRVMTKVAGEQLDSPAAVQAVFEQEISPHLDFSTITRWLAGDRWEALETRDRQELLDVVRAHIVQVYAGLLARGGAAKIEVEQRSTVRTRSARVGARLATPAGDSFDIEFRLLLNGEAWKLYDLAVGGLSFARSLRAEIAPVLASGGVAGVKAYLEAHGT